MTAEKQALIELTRIRKALVKGTKAIKKKGKKIKLSELLEPENINERINAFIDKLTLEDLLAVGAITSGIVIAYPIIYRLKTPEWWVEAARFLPFPFKPLIEGLGDIFGTPEYQGLKLDLSCLAVTILVVYMVIYKGANMLTFANLLVGSL